MRILCFLMEVVVGTMVWLGFGLTAKHLIGINDYPWVMVVGAVAFIFVSLSMDMVRVTFGREES